jgi:hypothetical protein
MSPHPDKWYFKTHWLVIGFLCVGPFMLPLVWLNPGYSRRTKVIVTVVVAIASYVLFVVMLDSIRSIMDYYRFMLEELDELEK